jgi:hypothetical protein
MPDVIQKLKSDVDMAIDFYNQDPEIKETIDLFFDQVNKNLPKEKPAPKKPAVKIEDARKPKHKPNELLKTKKVNDTVYEIRTNANGSKFVFLVDGKGTDVGDYETILDKYNSFKEAKKPAAKKVSKPAPKKTNYKGRKVEIIPLDINPNQFIIWDIKYNQKFANEKFYGYESAKKFVDDNKMILVAKKPNVKVESQCLSDVIVGDDGDSPIAAINEATGKIEKWYVDKNEVDPFVVKMVQDLATKKKATHKPKRKPAPKKKDTLKTKINAKTVDAYNKEFLLIRRFYNMLNQKNISFRKIQLLYMAFQKAIVSKSVSKKNVRNTALFTAVNKKVVKMYESVVDKQNSASSIELRDETILSQMEALVKGTKVNYAVTLLKSYISLQNLQPEVKKVERLLKRFDNAITTKRINENNRLWSEVKDAHKELKRYVKNPSKEIPVEVYGLAAPCVNRIKCTGVNSNGQLKKGYKWTAGGKVVKVRSSKKKVETKGMAQPIVFESPEDPVFEITKVVDEETIVPAIENIDAVVPVAPQIKEPASQPKKETVNEVNLRNLGFTKAVEAPDEPEGLFTLPGAVGEFLQTIQPFQELILIKGTKHTSKSQLAMQIANAIGEYGKQVGYIDYEQGGVQSKDTINSLKWNTTPAGKENIFIIGELDNAFETLRGFCKHFFAIVADSVTDLGISADQLSDLRKEFPHVIWIFISQVKESGAMYGGNKMAHNPTKIIECHTHNDPRFRYATLEKNRGNKLDKYYSMYYKKLIPNPQEVPIEELAEENQIIKTVYM